MSLWLKTAFLRGRSLMQHPILERLPQITYEQKRTAFFTMGKQRMGKRKGRKPKVVEERVPVTLSKLYGDDIDSAVFEERADDGPTEGMVNPFQVAKRQCILCKHNITPDYKNVKLLSQFISSQTGRVYGRHITGLCRDQQERVEKEIFKSRFAGFMAYYYKHPEFLEDPKLCDPSRPLRPHPF